MSILSKIFSSTPKEKKEISPSSMVGAFASGDQYETYADSLLWIKETKNKLPELEAQDREDAFNVDPLVKGIISPFLKNIILGDYRIETADNKKFEPAIKEIRAWLESIGVMDAFREDFDDYMIKHGKSFRRKDYEGEKLIKLSKLDCASTNVYHDPFDFDTVAYHQKIKVATSWTEEPDTTEYNSWFVPGGELYIQGTDENPNALKTFKELQTKYGIKDTMNLRVDSNDRIVYMNRGDEGDPAPIDTAVALIWLKSLMIVNSPNMIYRILSPIVQVKNGMMYTATEGGETVMSSTVPPYPPAAMQTNDPEMYTAMMADYDAYLTSCQTTATTIMKCLKDGGVFSGGPDLEFNVIESGRNLSYLFVREMTNMFDEQIGMCLSFPVSLIKATGSELATSQTIKDIFNVVFAGERGEYEGIMFDLAFENFGSSSWQYEMQLADEQMERGSFTFDEMELKIVIDTGDVKDQLKLAQTKLASAQTLAAVKALGASKSDVQALGEEYGFGMLGLDGYDNQPVGKFGLPDQPPEPEEEIKSTVTEDEFPEEDEETIQALKRAYDEARKAIEKL